VVEDPEQIAPTPRFGLDESLNSAAEDIKASLSSSYSLARSGVKTRTVGRVYANEQADFERELENEILDIAVRGSAKRPRQVDQDDLDAVESEANEVRIDPDQPILASLPTFTVDSNGDLNIPTPSVEKVEPHVELKVAERQHRFLPPPKQTKSVLDSVTYVGFVDFTTTIDDTVVIFKPKNNFHTQAKITHEPRIEPTRAFTSSSQPTLRTSIREPIFSEVAPSTVESSFEREDLSARKQTSGINALKSLLASSAAARSSARNTRFNPASRGIVRPTLRPALGEIESEPQLEGSEGPAIDSSIEPEVNVELVYKTFFTTYSYLTTLFRDEQTKTKTRTEIVSNILTLTNILDPEDLPTTSTITRSPVLGDLNSKSDTFGRLSSELEERPRTEGGRKIDGYLYTTYTLLSTLYDDDRKTSRVVTTTEVFSNKHNGGFVAPSPTFVVPSSTVAPSPSIFSISPSKSIISAFPIRRLEVSSIRDRQLQSELTTPETTTDDARDAITTEEIFTSRPASDDANDDGTEESATTTEPLQLIQAVTESSTESSETTESNEEDGQQSSSPVIKTMYTTFTFFTTLFKDNTTSVTRNMETVTNIMTDPLMTVHTDNPSVTLYTTFTYWNTIIDGNKTIISSNEQTKTDVLPSSEIHNLIDQTAILGDNNSDKIAVTSPVNSVIEQTVFSLPTSTLADDLEGTTTFSSVGSSLAFDDDDLTLTSNEDEDDENTDDDDGDDEEENEDDDEDDAVLDTRQKLLSNVGRRRIIRPSRTRLRASISRPGNTFTPVIRPILGRKPLRVVRPTNLAVSTTVATRTRNSIKPTLIATPASSAPLNTPIFNQSSRILASASLFNRGRQSSSGGFSSSINPSSVLSSGASIVVTESPTTTPSIIISPKSTRKPFRVRLKELQQERIRKLKERTQKTETEPTSFPIPNLPSIPGGNAPIFVSSQRQTISRPTSSSADSSLSISDDLAARRERAREKIKSLFARRRNQAQQSRRKRQQLGEKFGQF